jgi:predicted Zn-dependent protease with MMP-like domain
VVVDVGPEHFDELVDLALDELPADLAAAVDNVAVLVADEPPEPGLLGLYEGVPLTEREAYGAVGTLPDRIWIFRLPICAVCDDFADVVDEIYVTVVHEVAHHFGIDDERLHELGWA